VARASCPQCAILRAGAGAQRRPRQAADVKFLVAVQADVNKIGRDVFRIRPLAGGIRENERDVVAAKLQHERLIGAALVPDFHRVAQRPVPVDGEPAAAGHAGIAAACEGECGLRIPRQQLKKVFEPLFVITELRRKLPEKRAGFFREVEDTGGEEIGERLLDVGEPQQMGDVAAALDGKHEVCRRLVAPCVVTFRALQRIKRAVDFDRGKGARGIFEFPPLRESGRIENAAPRLVAPARDADSYQAHNAVRLVRRRGFSG
jgi:hypothetical protein